MSETETPPEADEGRLTTDMDYDDWMDVAESEFVDIAEGNLTEKTVFVFEHDELGYHGFEWQPEVNHLRAVVLNQMEEKPEGDDGE